jgi:streptogramin lyase
MQALDDGSQQFAAEAAKRANPAAIAARAASRTAYANISRPAIRRLLDRDFPTVTKHFAGAMPELPPGARIVGYPSVDTVQLALPDHRIGLVDSAWPLAKRTPGHRLIPIDLAIESTRAGYAPTVSDVGVRIPRSIAQGVEIPENGVTLTPVDAAGRTLSGLGVPVGASVVYADTQPSTDTVVKPTPLGFQLDALLRSAGSPQRLLFEVRAPRGFRLLQDRASEVVRVQVNGVTIATILAPGAEDAGGTQVPVRMSVRGHAIAIDVAHRAGSYQYPIDVDPEVNDSQLATTSGGRRSNWQFGTSNGSRFAHNAIYEGPGKERLETSGSAEYGLGEYAYWVYQTQGNSKIYEFKAKTAAHNTGAKIESFLEFANPGGSESKLLLSTEIEHTAEYGEKNSVLCAVNAKHEQECLPGAGSEKNFVRFQQSATGSPGGSYRFSDTLMEGIVSISEPVGEHSSTSFNTTSPEVEGEIESEGKKIVQKRANALYGTGSWLTNSKGGLQLIAKDPGIGVAATHLEYEASPGKWESLPEHNYLESENGCMGVQCYPEHREYWTLNPKLPNGEDELRYRAHEAIVGTESLESEQNSTKTVKVDTAAPHGLFLNGLPYGNELSERPYKLSAEAVDGEGSTVASSGVRSIAMFISGREIAETGKQAGCTVSKGECRATAEWSINGAQLGAGHHAIVIVATDNAGNESRIEQTISIRHSTPVPLGPGSVDLQSGDFALSATDVSMGSGLTLARNYSSRALEAGQEGPLGPQWSLSLASTESLSEMVDGGVLMTAANGSQTIFAPLGGGQFESPTGDSNLKLTLEENKTTKQKLAYYLEDAAAHTKTKFTLPSSTSKLWMPAKQEGAVATATVSYAYRTVEHVEELPLAASTKPDQIVAGPDGNLWYSTWYGTTYGRVTPTGLVRETKMPEEEPADDMIAGSDGNMWFASMGHIDEMTTSGKVIARYPTPHGVSQLTQGAEGDIWFTRNENAIYKMTPSGVVTEYTVVPPPGDFSEPGALVAGPDGNIWFTDWGSGLYSAIWKITPSGEMTKYMLSRSAAPSAITVGPDGNLWFSEGGARIGKITTSGAVTEYSLPPEGSPEAITAGPDGDMWFTEPSRNKIGKITTSGAITEYPLPAESEPFGIAAGPDGKMWFTDLRSSEVGTISTSGTLTEPTEVLAPVPAGVSCAPEIKAGCRALKFKYATTTTASGVGSSGWGEFKGRLSQVLLEAFNPTSKKMQQTAVAEYQYDNRGELRAEWDPRVSPALKTTYGYDEAGHLTALSSPGRQPWIFSYGTADGDLGTGRLVKLMQPPAEAPVWGGEPVKNTEAARISGSVVEGAQLTVSNGAWAGAPAAYSYQWLRCLSPEEACAPIVGATNPNYTPQFADVGHALGVTVTATNADGSVGVSAYTATTVSRRLTEYSLPSGRKPFGIVMGPDKDLWFTDSGSGEVGKLTSSGALTEYETKANTDELEGIASGPDGNLWLVEHGARGVDHVTTGGVFTKYLLTRASTGNVGIAVGSDANLWFTESKPGYIGKINTADEVLGEYVLPSGSTPYGIAAGPDNNLWFTDYGTSKIGKITTSGTITEYALPSGSEPWGIAAGPEKDLWFTDYGTNKVGKITTSGAITEYALPAGSLPRGITAGTEGTGTVWVADSGTSKIAEVTSTGSVTETSLPSGSEPYGVTMGPEGLIWFTDHGTNKVGVLGATVGSEGETRSPQPGTALDYDVPLTGASGLPAMTGGEVARWGQTDAPVEATAIVPADADQAWPANSYKRATAYYLDAEGRTVNQASPSNAAQGAVSTTEYNELNDVVRTLTPANRQTALEAGSSSVEISKMLDTESTYNGEGEKEAGVEEPGTRLIKVLGPQHKIKYYAGKEQKESLARLNTKYFYDEGAPGGEAYDLVTKASSLAQLANEEEVEVRKTVTSYSGQGNLGWKLRSPTSVTSDPEGKKITSSTIYNAISGQIAEKRGTEGGAGESAHDTKMIYYSAEANTEGYAACGAHPEWAGLVCETLPAKQPEGSGVPKLPVTLTTYNIWDEPLTVTETFGSTVRTKTDTYDEGGRLIGSETTSTADQALPKVTDEYNSKTGLLEKQSTTSEGHTKTLTSKYNSLGQMIQYTDSDGNTATYKFATPEHDGVLEEMTDSGDGGADRQTYSYNATTMAMEKLTDSAAETFTASYDTEGQLSSELYPNGMCADYSYNAVGEATQIEYVKTTNCAEREKSVWFSESRTPSVRGETYSRSNTLTGDTYAYDTLGRLVETQETPAGEGCQTRIYAYDEESNRTSLTTVAPGSKGECTSTGGTVQSHTYDEANRLSDAGVAYDSFGNVTKLPAADAEGHELTSSFYVDNAVAAQSQNGVTNSYSLDPEGRVREVSTGTSSQVLHYDGPGEAVAWTAEGLNTTRNIPNLDGTLVATQTNGEAPVLQLHDLQGDVVATAALSPSPTKLLSTYNSTEFGVPSGGKAPPKYAWLGAGDIASALSSGVITYGATSYVPQTGRALQSEAVDPPGAPNGTGVGTPYTLQEEPWVMQRAAAEAAEAPALEAAREQAAFDAALAAAEAVDPSELLSLADARIKGEQFLKIATAAEIIDVIGSIPDGIESKVEGAIWDLFSVDSALEWYHQAGQKLVECSYLYSKGFRRCLFTYSDKTIGWGFLSVTLTDIFDAPEVEKCAPPLLHLSENPIVSWRCERLGQNNFTP